MACPIAWPRWSLAKRVKSGMFSETVDQNPTVPLSAGIKNFRNSVLSLNFGVAESIGPKPPALRYAHASRTNPTASSTGALMPCRNLMYSMPASTTAKLIAQKSMKQIPTLCGTELHAGHKVASRVLMASPPIHVWMPNHPQATIARNTAATFAPSTPNDDRASTGKGMPYFAPGIEFNSIGASTIVLPMKTVNTACFQSIPPWIRLAANIYVRMLTDIETHSAA